MNRNLKISLMIGAIAIALLVILPLTLGLVTGWGTCGYEMLEHAEEEEYHMMGPWMMGGFGWMWLMPIFWILILGLIIWAVVAAIHRPSESDRQIRLADSALDILEKRYARGEIDKKEYEEKKKDLS